ncbi:MULTISPECIES: hypothetical protein [unclassified Streptomyces]|uniref:hypothetical protein n=1 Tax=unclassified Streptomyces TaxID=2593676 RepID=UPI00236655D5|nr:MULTISPECIES: hypothetical protein [unclassified Streptomyces]MDF3141788.1 hypothetical protein [Streptomyces sp. T21Q-yed]WDF36437.1 hypothetical protein PBV52_06445 [Streptomyces sp. T12]
MTNDSDALRARRYRAHSRGEHHLCSPDRCWGARTLDGDDDEAPATITAAVHAFIGALPEGVDDGARAVLAQVAERLAEAMDHGRPGPGLGVLSRELRSVIGALGEAEQSDSYAVLDDLKAKRAQRRVSLLLDAFPN